MGSFWSRWAVSSHLATACVLRHRVRLEPQSPDVSGLPVLPAQFSPFFSECCSCQHRWQNNARRMSESVQKNARFVVTFNGGLSSECPLPLEAQRQISLILQAFAGLVGRIACVQKVTPPYSRSWVRAVADLWKTTLTAHHTHSIRHHERVSKMKKS